MHPKQRVVKLAIVLLPFLCFAAECPVKNKFCLLPTESNSSLEFLLCKENVQRTIYRSASITGSTNIFDLAAPPAT
jgi:hypothetical protein